MQSRPDEHVLQWLDIVFDIDQFVFHPYFDEILSNGQIFENFQKNNVVIFELA
jgi:hypothetical protein